MHLVTHDQVGRRLQGRPLLSPLSRSRQVAGWLSALLLPVLLTAVLTRVEGPGQLPLAEMLLLAAAVLVALVGGLLPALLAALLGFVLLNWYFTEPVGRLTIAQPSDVVALLVYVAVAAGVASVVDRASRRAADALRARTEAATLASLSRSVLTGQDTAEAVTERVREVFGQTSVALLARGAAASVDAGGADGRADASSGRTPGTAGSAGGAPAPTGWRVVAASGDGPAATPEAADTRVRVDDVHELCLRGETLRASDQRVLEAFAVQASLVLEHRRLRAREERAVALEGAEATSTALLQAVSHDLRTPLATMRASVDGLIGSGPGGADLDPTDRAALVSSVGASTEQLEGLIDNLLDLSRLRTGLVHPVLADRSLEEVLPLAVSGHAPGAVSLEVAEDTPLVRTDAGLLERVVANLVANAVRVSDGVAVRVLAHVQPTSVEVLVVDRGPGVPPAERARMFEPFQRLGDRSPGGLGLGLAVARGLAEAVGASLEADDTPGGGLTMVLSVPRAGAVRTPRATHRPPHRPTRPTGRRPAGTGRRGWPGERAGAHRPVARARVGRRRRRPAAPAGAGGRGRGAAGPRPRGQPARRRLGRHHRPRRPHGARGRRRGAPRRGAARPRPARPRRHRGDHRPARLDQRADRGALRAPARRGQGRGARPRRRRLRHQALRDERAHGPAAGRRAPRRRDRRPRRARGGRGRAAHRPGPQSASRGAGTTYGSRPRSGPSSSCSRATWGGW